MPRRKQDHPRPKIGRVEDRDEKPDIDTCAENPNESQRDLELEEWEIKHSFSGRPKKRAKKASAVDSRLEIHSKPSAYAFAELSLRILRGNANELTRVNVAVELDGELHLEDEETHSAASIRAPSTDAAENLLALWKSGHVVVSRGGEEGPDACEGQETSLVLGLGMRVQKEATSDPEDEKWRQASVRLLHLLRWVCPWADLDPNADEPVEGRRHAIESPSGLRPCEGVCTASCEERDNPQTAEDTGIREHFDPAELYRAVKPSGSEPEYKGDLPELRPALRGYQRRAVWWMLCREGAPDTSGNPMLDTDKQTHDSEAMHPLWREIHCIPSDKSSVKPAKCSYESSRSFFINPWNGAVSFERFEAPEVACGGIACDEMGLGKTVEMLALIMANRYRGKAPSFKSSREKRQGEKLTRKTECVCGRDYPHVDRELDVVWIQCQKCLIWLHGICVGYPRRPPKNGFVCQTCQQAEASASVSEPCGTTLIVCPTPIVWQWYEEISRHVVPGALKIFVYEGQPQWGCERQGTGKVVNARDLANADIVLTTYDVLRKDLDHCSTELGMTLRQKKRYKIIPTPLTRLSFWRIVVDEAQMVENSTAAATEMVRRLKCRHRWCVTGTPISRGLDDLQGLFAFLQLRPYANRTWWRRCIQIPYEAGMLSARSRLLSILKPTMGGIMWRSAKSDVRHELGLPEQHHHLTRLRLSAIERHFYSRQHQDCVGKARRALSSSKLAAAEAAAASTVLAASADIEGERLVDAKSPTNQHDMNSKFKDEETKGTSAFKDRLLTRTEERKLLYPLLRLRQACVHPQIGSSGIRSLAASRRPMSMLEVLDVLITKATVEAEEAQRQLIFSLNGLAGLLLLQGKRKEASEAYREALRHIRESKERKVETDPLLQIHTMHNLLELLDTSSDLGIARTLRDDDMRRCIQSLRDEYCAEAVARLEDVEQKMKATVRAIEDIKGDLDRWPSPNQREIMEMWFVDAIRLLTHHSSDRGATCVIRVRERLSEENTYRSATLRNAMSLTSRNFETLHGLMTILSEEMKSLRHCYDDVFEELAALSSLCAANPPPKDLIELAASCSRCRSETAVRGHICRHCKLDEKFIRLQVRLFAIIAPSLKAGAELTAEQVAEQLIRQSLSRVGRGGFREENGPEDCGASAKGRQAGQASRIQQQDLKPSQLEMALRLLHNDLKSLKMPRDDGAAQAQKEMLTAFGKAHLQVLELWREQFIKARALATEQRQKLYMYDELGMCVSRVEIRLPEEEVPPGMELLKIHEAEIPVRSVELSTDKAVAEDVLKRKIGTLNYLESLQAGQMEKQKRVILCDDEGERNGSRIPNQASSASKPPMISNSLVAGELGAKSNHPETDECRKDEPCPVCQEPLGGFTEICMFVCGHRICFGCQDLLVERIPVPMRQKGHIACPTCRIRVSVTDVCVITNQIDHYDVMKLEGSSPSINGIGPNGDASGTSAPPRSQEEIHQAPWRRIEESIEISGSYGTKLEAVLRRVKAILADESSRILVFSSWKESLELLSHAMEANGISHLYPRSRKTFNDAVTLFKGEREPPQIKIGFDLRRRKLGGARGAQRKDDDTSSDEQGHRVLLLLLKQGGNGLNLQQAQHVILVEPLLDPAEESQAIGRVDRIGQENETHVHRFVVRDSIEENVHRLGKHRAAEMDLSAAAVRRGKPSREQGGLTLRDVAALLYCDSGNTFVDG